MSTRRKARKWVNAKIATAGSVYENRYEIINSLLGENRERRREERWTCVLENPVADHISLLSIKGSKQARRHICTHKGYYSRHLPAAAGGPIWYFQVCENDFKCALDARNFHLPSSSITSDPFLNAAPHRHRFLCCILFLGFATAPHPDLIRCWDPTVKHFRWCSQSVGHPQLKYVRSTEENPCPSMKPN